MLRIVAYGVKRERPSKGLYKTIMKSPMTTTQSRCSTLMAECLKRISMQLAERAKKAGAEDPKLEERLKSKCKKRYKKCIRKIGAPYMKKVIMPTSSEEIMEMAVQTMLEDKEPIYEYLKGAKIIG